MYRLTILFAILLAIILNTKIGAQNPTFLDLLKFPIDPVSVGRGETGVAFAYGLQSLSI
ncbi:MAG: hypothetical protein GWN62_13235, partial [Aliifodinibius sp.]|nr:hypothetical protein [Fodinibius sp.]